MKIPRLFKSLFLLFQGPSRTLGMVVGLAISLATAGTGTQLGVSVANGMGLASHTVAHGVVSHMTMAAFSSLCVQGGTALIQEQGNIGKAAQSLTKAPFLKSLTRNVITAGLTQGIAGGLEIELKSLNLSKGSLNTQFIGHLKANLVKGIAKGTVDVAMGDSFDKVLKRTLKEVPLKTVQEVAVNQIGLAYGEGEINPLIHKFLHGIVGAATGAVRGKDPTQGAIDGACAAIMAETMAEGIQLQVTERARELAEGGNLTDEMIQAQILEEFEPAIEAIKGINGILFQAMGRDARIAEEVSETALRNNWVSGLPVVIAAAIQGVKVTAKKGVELLAKKGLKESAKESAKKTAKESAKKAAKEEVKETSKKGVKEGVNIHSGFNGKKGFELKNPKFQPTKNTGSKIDNIDYSAHALDQMQNRGIYPTVVENAIKNGTEYIGRAGTKTFYDKINDIRVILNSQTNKVITVTRGKP